MKLFRMLAFPDGAAKSKSETHFRFQINGSGHENFYQNLHIHKAATIFGKNRSALECFSEPCVLSALLSSQPFPPTSQPQLVSSSPSPSPQLVWQGVGQGRVPSILPELHHGSGRPALPATGLISQRCPSVRDLSLGNGTGWFIRNSGTHCQGE